MEVLLLAPLPAPVIEWFELHDGDMWTDGGGVCGARFPLRESFVVVVKGGDAGLKDRRWRFGEASPDEDMG